MQFRPFDSKVKCYTLFYNPYNLLFSDLSKIQKLKQLLEKKLKELERQNEVRNTEEVCKINKDIVGVDNGYGDIVTKFDLKMNDLCLGVF